MQVSIAAASCQSVTTTRIFGCLPFRSRHTSASINIVATTCTSAAATLQLHLELVSGHDNCHAGAMLAQTICTATAVQHKIATAACSLQLLSSQHHQVPPTLGKQTSLPFISLTAHPPAASQLSSASQLNQLSSASQFSRHADI
jgi:hypothetical protein